MLTNQILSILKSCLFITGGLMLFGGADYDACLMLSI
jgi:hypothetical protein